MNYQAVVLTALKDLLWQFLDRVPDPIDSELETVDSIRQLISAIENDGRTHIPIPDSPYTIDLANSDNEYLYIELKQGVTVVIKATDEGIVIDAFPQHTQD